MSVINSQPLIGASGNQGGAYNIERSLRFRSSASAYLNRTPSATNRKTWTYSFWAKLGNIAANKCFMEAGVSGADTYTLIWVESNGAFRITQDEGAGGTLLLASSALHRDPSAWYHFIVAVDTTQATDTNRVKMYVNGVQITSFSTTTYPTQNRDTYINSTFQHRIGTRVRGTGMEYDGYMTEVNFIDGQQLTPSSFGETDTITGVWKPKRYSGTYGTNGFYLKFNDLTSTSTLGNDSSGNSNTWTVNNVSLTAGATYDSMTDVPTLTSATAANYAVMNPLFNSAVTHSNGNLSISVGSSSTPTAAASIGVSSGKWYWEVTMTSASNMTGIISSSDKASMTYVGSTATSYGYYQTGVKYTNASSTSYGASYTTNDVIGVALDMDAGTIVFYKNNTSQGTAFSSLSGTFFPASGNDGVANSYAYNFGQRPFAYTPPSGFVALNTFNLPTSTIVAGNKVMDATLYTGTGSALTVTNTGIFKPDLVWAKVRSAIGDHNLYDSVRAVTKRLSSNLTSAEDTVSGVTSFNSNGFTLGTSTSSNTNAATYAAWQWQAGQGSSSSNTAGSITSTVSVNVSAGFSIVTYTGTGVNATIGHGLGVAPKMVIVKCRNTAGESWQVYHSNLTSAAYRIRLNSADGQDSQPTMWNSTAPTSSVFSVGTATGTNANTQTYVAYCWTDVNGFAKFGGYTGNGSTDGTFVYTGFRPKYILIKRTDTATYQWSTWDTVRNTYNAANSNLWSDSTEAETTSTGYDIDILSNGFKLRTTNVARNANGGTYIYAAFAENPFKNSLAR